MTFKTLVPALFIGLAAIAGPAQAHIVGTAHCGRFSHGMRQMCVETAQIHNMYHQVRGTIRHNAHAPAPQNNAFSGLGPFSGLGAITDVIPGLNVK